jgi:hypothetical protein
MGKTLRVLACDLGEPIFSIATLSAVLRGKPGTLTMTSEDDLRQRLGLPAISPHITPACPTCGGAHVLADCHGAEIVAVVALAPGETVHRPGKARARKRYHRPCMDDATYAEWLAFRAQRKEQP